MSDQFRRPMRIFPRNPTNAERRWQQMAFDRYAQRLLDAEKPKAQVVRSNSVGYWEMPTYSRRPSRWIRFWMRTLLGWKWNDT